MKAGYCGSAVAYRCDLFDGLLPIVSNNFMSVHNIRNIVRYLYGRTHLATETRPQKGMWEKNENIVGQRQVLYDEWGSITWYTIFRVPGKTWLPGASGSSAMYTDMTAGWSLMRRTSRWIVVLPQRSEPTIPYCTLMPTAAARSRKACSTIALHHCIFSVRFCFSTRYTACVWKDTRGAKLRVCGMIHVALNCVCVEGYTWR